MKNKYILFIAFFLLINAKTDAQQINFDTLIMPINSPSPFFQEYLVQVAWINNPANEVYEHNINIAQEEVKITKLDWANDVGLTFNLNENNIQKKESSLTDEQTMVLVDNEIGYLADLANLNQFPRYNFAVTLNLGRILNLNKEIKKSQELLKIEELHLDQKKLEIRAEVIRRYQAYLQAGELVQIRKQTEADFKQTYKLIESRFKEGNSDFEEFSRASSSYQQSRESTLVAKSDLVQTKIDVEEMIGISLELANQLHQQAFEE